MIDVFSIQYIYIIITREFINSRQNIYKIGKTGNIIQRLSAYPKGSKLLFTITCDKMSIVETHIIEDFKKLYKQRTDLGTEYFQGNLESMQKNIISIIDQYKNILINDNLAYSSIIIQSYYRKYMKRKQNQMTHRKIQNFIKDKFIKDRQNFIDMSKVKKLWNLNYKDDLFLKNDDFVHIFKYYLGSISVKNNIFGWYGFDFKQNKIVKEYENKQIINDPYKEFILLKLQKTNSNLDRLNIVDINRVCGQWMNNEYPNVKLKKNDVKEAVEKIAGILNTSLWIDNTSVRGWSYLKWINNK